MSYTDHSAASLKVERAYYIGADRNITAMEASSWIQTRIRYRHVLKWFDSIVEQLIWTLEPVSLLAIYINTILLKV